MQLINSNKIIFIVFVLFSYCSIKNFVSCDYNDYHNEQNVQIDESNTGKESMQENVYPKEFSENYLKMFKSKRIEQQNAVRRLLEIKDHKTNDMLKKVIQKIFDTLKASLSVLAKAHENSNSEDGRIQFDKKIANELSIILENTAFSADLSLHFSRVFHKLYDKNYEWHTILETAIAFTMRSNLIDEETKHAIHLMSQELDIIEKEPNYVNPYKRDKNKLVEDALDEKELLAEKDMKKKKKEKRPRGPGLSGVKREL